MTRKTKIRSLVLGLAATALALTGLAGSATASGPAPTKVQIIAESGGFYGFVKSPKLDCKSERTVVLYRQLGARQRPASDQQVGMDLTEANGEWDMGNPGLHTGRYYARAVRTPTCLAANSVTLRAQQ